MFRRILKSVMFMSPRDIGLFLRSAKTDSAIARQRLAATNEAAFDAAYLGDADPWRSGDTRYTYQSRKYDVLAGLLPRRRFGHVLDLGCGHGLLGRRVAANAQSVMGIDISNAAVQRARRLHAGQSNMHFEQGDAVALPQAMSGRFDLILLVDTMYYLPPPISDTTLKAMAIKVAGLLAPNGICLLANHFFFAADPDSRLSRRVHRAFAWSPAFNVVSEHRRPFYIATLLSGCAVEAPAQVVQPSQMPGPAVG